MNLPNLLSLSRIPLLFVVVGLLWAPFTGARTAAFVVFVIAALTDWLDGYVARKTNQVSDFGKLMDALTDKVFVVGLFVSLLVVQSAGTTSCCGAVLPVWSLPLLLLIIAREFLITGLRLVAASSGIVLAAERAGKHKTVSQIVSLVLLLLHEAVAADFPRLLPETVLAAGYWAGLVFFVIATVLTVSSGTRYLVKHWAVFTGKAPE